MNAIILSLRPSLHGNVFIVVVVVVMIMLLCGVCCIVSFCFYFLSQRILFKLVSSKIFLFGFYSVLLLFLHSCVWGKLTFTLVSR